MTWFNEKAAGGLATCSRGLSEPNTHSLPHRLCVCIRKVPMKFSDRLKQLGFSSYADYLASETWKGFKERYRDAGNRLTCAVCDGRRVQLHHHTYERLGCEHFGDITPLCRAHHEAVHEWLKNSGKLFVKYTHEAVAALAGNLPPVIVLPSRPLAQGKPKKHRSRSKAEALAIREASKQSAHKPLLTRLEKKASSHASDPHHQLC